LTATVVAAPSVAQAITVDSKAPVIRPTVTSQNTADTTPTVTGTATLGPAEALTVTLNGVSYTVGDGNLTVEADVWSLTVPLSQALTRASTGPGFNGSYNVTATVRDTAGNSISDSTSGELTIQDTTSPTVDLDPVDGGQIDRTVSSLGGALVSLDDDSLPATVDEASDTVRYLQITVGGLQDGSAEELTLGGTRVAADGSGGTQSGLIVGSEFSPSESRTTPTSRRLRLRR
jgi:hypothetical protein